MKIFNNVEGWYLGRDYFQPLDLGYLYYKFEKFYNAIIKKINEYNGILRGTFNVIYFTAKEDAIKFLDFFDSLMIIDKLVR